MKRFLNFFENKKAITLISLVVTIVILVILSAVAINIAVGNNGLVNKIKLAKEEYANQADKEKEDICVLTNDIDEISDSNIGVEGTRGKIMVDETEYNKLLNDVERLSTIESIAFTLNNDTINDCRIWCKKNGHIVTFVIEGSNGSKNIVANKPILIATGLPKCVIPIQELNITIDSASHYQRAWVNSTGEVYMFTSYPNYTGNIFIGGTYITSE